MDRPRIGLTVDAQPDRVFCRLRYVDAIVAAGGVPLLLAPPSEEVDELAELVRAMLAVCDGVVLTGGDDPRTESFGEPTHPSATPVEARRQAFELEVLSQISSEPDTPTLGICLGMQMMALHAGGRLDQHLPDGRDPAGLHWGRRPHPVGGRIGSGMVLSHHRQAVIDPGRLEVVAMAPDGIIEAIRDGRRPYFLGVQWHPELTEDTNLGGALLRGLVDAARHRAASMKRPL